MSSLPAQEGCPGPLAQTVSRRLLETSEEGHPQAAWAPVPLLGCPHSAKALLISEGTAGGPACAAASCPWGAARCRCAGVRAQRAVRYLLSSLHAAVGAALQVLQCTGNACANVSAMSCQTLQANCILCNISEAMSLPTLDKNFCMYTHKYTKFFGFIPNEFFRYY